METEWEPAQVHDFSAGGSFDIVAVGSFLTAALDSTELSGALTYNSNTLTTQVDGAAADKVRREFHENAKRTAVQSDCTGTERTSTINAESACRSLAAQASTAAASGAAAKVSEYFKSSTTATRSTVASVFAKVASECGSTTSGASDTYCTDVYGACASNVLAYTLPSQSYIVNCPLYFSALPALTTSCHAQDQATTTLHETTHLSEIAGTDDLGYGYTAATALSASRALQNADTYALFANGQFEIDLILELFVVALLTRLTFASYLRRMLNDCGKSSRSGLCTCVCEM